MVIPRSAVSNQRTQRVERRFEAILELLVHIDLNLIERYMAGPFDHHLATVFPRNPGQLTERLEFAQLSLVVGIGDTAGAHAVAQRKGNVVGTHDFTDFTKVGVEKVFGMMIDHPLGHD